jgi:ATP-dependent Clp protease ATP-binding subunit ClpX
MSDTEMLSTLPLIAASAEQVNKFMGDWIQLLRERKLSWAAIGKAMGISRQAAWERFTRDTGKNDSASTG